MIYMITNLYTILIRRTEDGDKTEWKVIAKTKEEAIDYATDYCVRNGYDYEILNIDERVLNFNKEVIDEYGDAQLIDESTREIYDYNNSKRKITYSAIKAPWSDEASYPSSCDYVEEGTVDDIEERMKTWNNPIKFLYASMVGFNASKNDPDNKIWDTFVEYVKNHESEFFTKKGDWKQRIQAVKNRMELELVNNFGNDN